MRTEEFDFALPERLIVQHPPEKRGESRLLHVRGGTLVLKARLFGEKESGGRVEVLVERILDAHHVLAQVRASKSPREGGSIVLAGEVPITVLGRDGEFYRLRFDRTEEVGELLERYGHLPLPPYIVHAATADDEERYQTVFARQPGAVAAPTAGLHFDQAMLDALQGRGASIAHVTLHVGACTFKPVRAVHLREHAMHSELFSVPQETVDVIRQAKERGGRVIAVGTTSLRALESAALASEGGLQAGSGETNIFIFPGYRFKVVDVLVTNFHLPRSTLLMLVCAFGGMQEMLAAYRHAVKNEYRFFSYGDAMLIERQG